MARQCAMCRREGFEVPANADVMAKGSVYFGERKRPFKGHLCNSHVESLQEQGADFKVLTPVATETEVVATQEEGPVVEAAETEQEATQSPGEGQTKQRNRRSKGSQRSRRKQELQQEEAADVVTVTQVAGEQHTEATEEATEEAVSHETVSRETEEDPDIQEPDYEGLNEELEGVLRD